MSELNSIELFKEKSGPPACHCHTEFPKSPHQAMEYLSRTWNRSSTSFFQLLSSNGLVEHLEHDGIEEELDQGFEEQRRSQKRIQCSRTTWTWLSTEVVFVYASKATPSYQDIKSWLRGELLRKLSRGLKGKRKAELRLHMAQVHAALSVATLAAAISGVVTSNLEPNNKKIIVGENDSKMGAVVASAAALMATVCAEVAESAGAHRYLVSSAISSGLAVETSADMLALTATAATCLRGAATLELRAATRMSGSQGKKRLANGAELLISTPRGKVEQRMLWIYLKADKVILRLGKKHLGGVLTTYKEHRIIDAMEIREGGGFAKHVCSLMLGTCDGAIQLFFQDSKQYTSWKKIIFQYLLALIRI